MWGKSKFYFLQMFWKEFFFQVVVFYLTFYIEEIVLFSLCNQGLNTYHHIGTSICVFIFFKRQQHL